MRASAVRAHDVECDREAVDFGNATLYLPACQLVVVVVAMCLVNAAMVTFPPRWAVSALRTLTAIFLTALVGSWRPVRIGSPRGLNEVFRAAKPCVWLYATALVIEQLCHACSHVHCDRTSVLAMASDGGDGGGGGGSALLRLCSHVVVVCMVCGGSTQSYYHMSRDDLLPFAVVATSLAALALMPQSGLAHGGAPFCDEVTSFEAVVRLLRACTFATTFVVHTFVCIENERRYITTDDVTTTSVRATAASVWTLVCPVGMLILAPLQTTVGVYRRTSFERWLGATGTDAEQPYAYYDTAVRPYGVETSDEDEGSGRCAGEGSAVRVALPSGHGAAAVLPHLDRHAQPAGHDRRRWLRC